MEKPVNIIQINKKTEIRLKLNCHVFYDADPMVQYKLFLKNKRFYLNVYNGGLDSSFVEIDGIKHYQNELYAKYGGCTMGLQGLVRDLWAKEIFGNAKTIEESVNEQPQKQLGKKKRVYKSKVPLEIRIITAKVEINNTDSGLFEFVEGYMDPDKLFESQNYYYELIDESRELTRLRHLGQLPSQKNPEIINYLEQDLLKLNKELEHKNKIFFSSHFDEDDNEKNDYGGFESEAELRKWFYSDSGNTNQFNKNEIVEHENLEQDLEELKNCDFDKLQNIISAELKSRNIVPENKDKQKMNIWELEKEEESQPNIILKILTWIIKKLLNLKPKN